MTDSHTLLSQYARTGSESAFRELVSRYIDLVYSTAFRLVDGDAESAQDVAQTVFVALAGKAGSLPEDVMLGGWLHQHTRFVAGKLMRTERRRQLRERQAAEMNAIEDHSESNLAQVAPVLDEAIGQLDAEDRTAILLRFFERNDFRSVGEAIGSSEDAARKRVDRALEKLHVLLRHRGATLSAAGLGTALATEAVTAAPAGLAATVSSAAVLTGTTLTGTVTAAKAIAMTTLQKTLISATLVAAVGTGIYEAHQASTLRGQVQALHEAQGSSSDKVEQSTRDHEDAARRIATLRDENERLNRNTTELLKLREEATRLRKDSQELASLKAAYARAGNEPAQSPAMAWLSKVKDLKQRLETMPGAKIPELQFLTEENWLDVAKGELKTDDDYRKALATLRMEGTTKFALMVSGALTKYAQANNGHFPTDLVQLQPYLNPDADNSILQRYQIIPSIYLSNGAPPNGSPIGEWVITQKNPVDEEKDVRISIGLKGIIERSYRTEMDRALDSAISAFAAANNGRMPQGIYDLQPYITSPAERVAFQKRITYNATNRAPVSVPVFR